MPASFVNCDWGTTRLRMRSVDLASLEVGGEFRSLDGVASVAQSHGPQTRSQGYRSLVADGLTDLAARETGLLADVPVLISGMASSSLGWQELPYARLPFPLDGRGLVWRELESVFTAEGEHRVFLLSGVRSETDVLRGEETELIGVFTLPAAERHSTSALVIKPGTHSKHLRVENGLLVDFRTFMTGELYDVLSQHSILQHSLAAAESELSDAELNDLRQACGWLAKRPSRRRDFASAPGSFSMAWPQIATGRFSAACCWVASWHILPRTKPPARR